MIYLVIYLFSIAVVTPPIADWRSKSAAAARNPVLSSLVAAAFLFIPVVNTLYAMLCIFGALTNKGVR